MRDEVTQETIAKAPGYGGVDRQVSLATLVSGSTRFNRITRMQVEPELARSWRVTLGVPLLENARSLASVSGGGGAAAPRGFPAEWPDFGQTNQSTTCHLTWGHGGATYEAWLDWRNGCTFCVHGNVVQVDLDLPLAAIAPNNIGARIESALARYAASISPDDSPSPHRDPPGLTFYLGNVGAGNDGSCAIPPFARAVRFHTNPFLDTVGPDELTLTTQTNFGTSYTSRRIRATDSDQPIALPPNARWLRVTNNAGLNSYDIFAEFLLDLG